MTYEQARDEMLSVFRTAWQAAQPIAPVQYPNVGQALAPPKTQGPWARVVVAHATGGQRTLAGEAGTRRFGRVGILTAQIFAPVGGGTDLAYNLAQLVVDAYEGQSTPGGAWFRNTRVNEVGVSDGWFQLNVLVDFDYDQVK